MSMATREKSLTWLALIAATGTLICCALPIVLVTLGLGATVAAIAANLPFLVTLTLYKAWLFAGSASLLAWSGWLLYRPGRECPADPVAAELCDRTLLWNRRIFWISVTLWNIGIFAAYIALPLRIWLNGD
jgi:hypothetical protein